MRTSKSNSDANSDEMSVSLIDVVRFFKGYYKTIFSIGLAGLVCALLATFLFGNYTATASLQNISGIDIPSLKYLQSALPKLEQENQEKQRDKSTAYLGSDQFWVQSIKPIILVGKADGKDLLDPSSLKSAGSNIASLQFIAKGTSEAVAESRNDEMTKTFINGAAYIGLRDLLRGYELKVIAADSNLNKKIGSAEVELVYVERRIQNLMILKNQYPSVATAPLQVVDAKDSGAKYLPISTQIVAATTDANSLRESLARYRDEEKQLPIYTQFIEKAKPHIENGRKDGNLVDSLLEVANQIEKNTQESVQKIALEDIRMALTSIQANKAFGLRQAGTIAITPPPYLKNTAIGLLAGLFLGFLLALGLTLVNQYKGTMSAASKVSPVSN
jgi:hypothetical protein